MGHGYIYLPAEATMVNLTEAKSEADMQHYTLTQKITVLFSPMNYHNKLKHITNMYNIYTGNTVQEKFKIQEL